MQTLTWENPGPAQRAKRDTVWSQVAEQLRGNPGQWALVHRFKGDRATASAGNLAWRIRQGHLAAFRPAGTFEAYSRGDAVYARYPTKEG